MSTILTWGVVVLNSLFLFYLGISNKKKERRDKDLEILKTDKLRITEKLKAIEDDWEKYSVEKAFSSSQRAHSRIDEIRQNYSEIINKFNEQEKSLLKMTLCVENLSEKIDKEHISLSKELVSNLEKAIKNVESVDSKSKRKSFISSS